MSGKIADIYGEVTWKFDQVKLRDIAKYIGDLNLASVLSATSLMGLGLEIKNLIDQTGQLAISLATIHSTTGIDKTFLQKFENASFELNSTKEAADSLITSFSKMKAQLNLPGGTVPVGLRMLGFTKADFEGTLEENMKMVWTRLSKSKPPANASQAIKEQWQGLLSQLAASFNVTSEQFMAMSKPEFEAKFNASPYLNESELKDNIDAVTAWKTAVVDLNTDLQKLVTTLTPALTILTKAVDTMVKGSNKVFKHSFDEYAWQKKPDRFTGILSRPVEDYLNKDLPRLVSELKKDFSAKLDSSGNVTASPSKNVTINSPVTVIANDIAGIEKWFETHWKKMMTKAANQFGLGST